MAQEENLLRYSSYTGTEGGGGAAVVVVGDTGLGSRSKKVKQKKVPQRGLGVAQLERIRLEEQQKREALQAANILANNAVGDLAVQNPNFRQNFPNSVPMPPLSPTTATNNNHNNPSPNSFFKPIPSIEILHQSSVQFSKIGGGELGILSPKLWNGEYNLDGGKPHHGFTFRALPIPQRSHQFHQDSFSSFSSSMVNASSGISPSSVLNSQMEPPSNQSFRRNNFRPSWIEEDKMVGAKRSYPFSLENPPTPSFNGNFRPISKSRSDELASCSNGYKCHIEPRNQYIRECPSNSSPLPEGNEAIREDERLNGDFLTLAPPAAASPSSNKNSSDFSSHHGQEQENSKNEMQWLVQRASSAQTFSFFPVKSQADCSTIHVSNGNGGKAEAIDLNLKL